MTSTEPAEALRELHVLLAECVRSGASDLHLTPGVRPCLRLHGDLHPIEAHAPLAPQTTHGWARALIRASRPNAADGDPFAATGAVDGALTSEDGTRFRFNLFRRQGQTALAFRRLEDTFRSLAELGLPESLHALSDLRDGLVVVSGPTGAGKSTTLATLLHRINQTRPCHIVTIEDPIEYLHRPLRSVVNQRQIGLDAPSFNDALVSSLRQDPDVILVGEIRDLDTIRTAITAAETGHLVFTTLHAGDCVSSIERLVGVFPADEQDGIRRQLSLVLRAVIAQHLLPALAANGRRERIATAEVLMVTPAVASLTALGKSAQIYSAMETGTAFGMQTLEQDLARLWVAGRIAEPVAMLTARNPGLLRDRAEVLRRRRAPALAGGVQ